ncbi:double-strand break repair protein AddB [Ruixingdingia sedimenti]|uniref:Double-strand break repair protein AddB n=1 Tax=Ruixingdingia sedimenti TaxID=3073604 RepID=A0ABU1F732_9RHOB|nr:double-strand break repair protein AddB [Xinfangfangia sp. LG-4]MDR5652681.1 double-strand break repair protein AddB [Xinfangfangia sp. LG-4]
MFEGPAPRVFGLAPGVDFPRALVEGLRTRLPGPPEALARVTLFVNTTRMRRRVTDLFAAAGPGLLPRIRLVSDLTHDPLPGVPAALPPLRRRLELTRLIARLLDAQPDMAPRAALYDLADSLAALMDEMAGEGVPPERVAALDVSDHSAHWQRTQAFLSIITPFFADSTAPDPEARRRLAVTLLAAAWAKAPPLGPVIVAGSTGSRGTTALLMQAVARLPQGAIILPGFDFTMPAAVWDNLDDALTAEDHPQYRFAHLLRGLDLRPGDVQAWCGTEPPDLGRNRLVSLALRPAPVTDQWLAEGAALPDLRAATAGLTLIEAPGPRDEALAIALILREAAEDGRRAALVTPDRGLARQVVAALDRWGILPDDSAGQPLALSAPGRFLRQVARLFGQRLTAPALLALLKHPLAHSGVDRGPHLLLVRELELDLRRNGPAFPDGPLLRAWASARGAEDWGVWLEQCLSGIDSIGERPLADHLAHHLSLAGTLAQGPGEGGTGRLWQDTAGEAAQAAVAALVAEADHGGPMGPADYDALFAALLHEEVRESAIPHPAIMIWGTLEARVQGADLAILGGLNDGTWPQLPPPDPWLNRQMRLRAGLLLPERRIGLSAHDFQQAIAAPQVVLTRAVRDAEAETLPSRWLNRLTNLMQGLAGRHGPEALADMRARGRVWLTHARSLETAENAVDRATRPAPRPPVAQRPRILPVTRIETLIRDPYAVYARHILRLYPLDPLGRAPDARLRGSVLHAVMERFALARPEAETPDAARDRLIATARAELDRLVPWPAARALWLSRIARVADWFVAFEAANPGVPVVLETPGAVTIPGVDITLTAKPDRIDMMPDGRLHVIDYKTGSPPSKDQLTHFNKQVLLTAALAERGGFAAIGPVEPGRGTYVGLGTSPEARAVDMGPEELQAAWAGLETLLARYARREQGYVSRRAVFNLRFGGDYDHLARYGEWDQSDPAVPVDVGGAE